jgi:hypothetical protein
VKPIIAILMRRRCIATTLAASVKEVLQLMRFARVCQIHVAAALRMLEAGIGCLPVVGGRGAWSASSWRATCCGPFTECTTAPRLEARLPRGRFGGYIQW